jgi:DNA-binding NarL/FixJ family response regulator
MNGHAETSSTPDSRWAGQVSAREGLSRPKTVLLVEDRSLVGEIFVHAIKEGAGEWNVHLIRNLEDARPEGALAVFSFMHRDSDSLFIAFALQQLRAKLGDTPLFVIIDSPDPAAIKTLGEAGLQGWISASMGFEAILSAIRRAMTVSPFLEEMQEPSNEGQQQPQKPAVQSSHAPPTPSMHSDTQPTLTEREIDVLSLLQKGKQNKVIAYALNISESTTKVHIRNIMRKYHLRNRTEVALKWEAVARQQGDQAF